MILYTLKASVEKQPDQAASRTVSVEYFHSVFIDEALNKLLVITLFYILLFIHLGRNIYFIARIWRSSYMRWEEFTEISKAYYQFRAIITHLS